jgi:hypothetical protein
MSSKREQQVSREQAQVQGGARQRELHRKQEENNSNINDDDNDVELLQALALTDDERRRAFQALDSFAFAK